MRAQGLLLWDLCATCAMSSQLECDELLIRRAGGSPSGVEGSVELD